MFFVLTEGLIYDTILQMSGKFFLIIGPSGSGKGTLVSHLRKNSVDLDLVFPVSCTTRERRPGEKEGETYYFVSREEFEERIRAGEFLEFAEYGGNFYGTLKREIVEPLESGRCVAREVEVQGAEAIMELFSREDLFIIYIDAGPWEKVERRIRGRAPISEDELILRRQRFEQEVTFKDRADLVVYNRDGEMKKAQGSILRGVAEVCRNLREQQKLVKL